MFYKLSQKHQRTTLFSHKKYSTRGIQDDRIPALPGAMLPDSSLQASSRYRTLATTITNVIATTDDEYKSKHPLPQAFSGNTMTQVKKAHKLITATFMGLVMVAGSAQAQNNTRALLEQTGVTTQIYSAVDLVAESSQVHAARCNTQPAGGSISGFNAESMIFDLLSAFEKNHTRSIKPIERWYQSALAKKIQTAEQETIDSSSLQRFLQSDHFKDPNRKHLISNIIDSLEVPRFIAVTGSEIEYAGLIHSGCIESAAATGKINREQTLADITRDDKDLIAILLRGEMIAETAFLYRGLSDTELESFASFTSSEEGRMFYSNLIDAVQASFTLASDRLTNSVKSELHGSIDF